MNPLPLAYGWIDDLQPLPRMVAEARKLYGIAEVQGSGDNPVILAWAKELGLAKIYNHDEIPWCGLFVAIVAKGGVSLMRNALRWSDAPLPALHLRP